MGEKNVTDNLARHGDYISAVANKRDVTVKHTFTLC